jgi:hypothetical protein
MEQADVQSQRESCVCDGCEPRHRPQRGVSLAQAGANVALIGRDATALEETAQAVKAARRKRSSSSPT